MSLMPDPAFYPSPGTAWKAAPEHVACVSLLNACVRMGNATPWALSISIRIRPLMVRLSAKWISPATITSCITSVGTHAARASVLQNPHPHMERRYLVVPGIGSSGFTSWIQKLNYNRPEIVKVIEPEEFIKKTGYTSPHTIHRGPDGIYGSALGSASGDGPGGIFLMDAETFELKGPWEKRARPPESGIRLLVAPRPRHHDHLRMGAHRIW